MIQLDVFAYVKIVLLNVQPSLRHHLYLISYGAFLSWILSGAALEFIICVQNLTCLWIVYICNMPENQPQLWG